MSVSVDSIAAQKVQQALSGVTARLNSVAQSTGISFSSTLAAAMETSEKEPKVVYNEAFKRYKPMDSSALKEEAAEEETEKTAGTTLSGANYDTKKYPDTYDDLISEACEKYGVDMALVKAVIRAESAYNPKAVSRVGAAGLMQLMPGTASDLGVTDAHDPEQNIDGGVRYLKKMLDRNDGDVRLALASYNWGPGAVSSRGLTDLTDSSQLAKIPNSTAGYINRILGYIDELNGNL